MITGNFPQGIFGNKDDFKDNRIVKIEWPLIQEWPGGINESI